MYWLRCRFTYINERTFFDASAAGDVTAAADAESCTLRNDGWRTERLVMHRSDFAHHSRMLRLNIMHTE